MKTLFFLLFPLLLSAQSYRIEGNIANLPNGEVYLMDIETYSLLDTAIVSDSHFVFDGKFLDGPQSVALYYGKPFCPFLAENSKIFLAGDFQNPDNVQVTGSAVQKDNAAFEAIFKQINDKYTAIFQTEQNRQVQSPAITPEAQDEDEDKLMAIQTEYMDKIKEALADFIRKNPNSNCLGYLAHSYYKDEMEYTKKEELWNLIPQDKKQETYAMRFKDNIDEAKSWLQQAAANFSMKTPEGKMVSLSDYKGKYVFVDFWASWCKPCRQENPKIVQAYEKFHPKGLEILGVSLDRDAISWQNAIRNDNLTWTQISDLKMWESEAVRIYRFQYIPFNLLIDPNGIVIAKNLRGKQLAAFLEDLF